MTIPNRNLGLLFFCEDFLSKSPRIFSENRSSWSEKLQKVYPNNWMQLDPLYSSFSILWYIWNTVYIRSTPHPVTVTTRIIAFLVGNPYKPSFATVTGWGVESMYIYIYFLGGAALIWSCHPMICRNFHKALRCSKLRCTGFFGEMHFRP